MTEHESCYIFKPTNLDLTAQCCQSDLGLQASWPLRQRICQEAWSGQLKRMEEVLWAANKATFESIIDFVRSSHIIRQRFKIPTGLIVGGPSFGSHGRFWETLSSVTSNASKSVFVPLRSAACSSLKNLLKSLINSATSRSDDNDDAGEDAIAVSSPAKANVLLSYDLQILSDWFQKQELNQVIVVFQDTEAFEGGTLADAIDLFSCWQDRIPFVLLFGIATSVDTFQEQLGQGAVQRLEGQKFDVTYADIMFEELFKTMVHKDVTLRVGPALATLLIDREYDHLQNSGALVDAVQYAYMTHFYANPLSIFLHKTLTVQELPDDHFEALRNLPSFRQHLEYLLDQGALEDAKDLLESDAELFRHTQEQVFETELTLNKMMMAVEVLHHIRGCIPKLAPVRRSALYVKAMSGELNPSPAVRDTILSVKMSPSNVLSELLEVIEPLIEAPEPHTVQSIRDELEKLVRSTSSSKGPLRSEYDEAHQTMRTTVVAQKVELSKKKSSLTKQDAAYSKIMLKFLKFLENYFDKAFIKPKELFLHEILIYDLKSPQRDAFSPRPRFAIERALSSPHDYLNCSCCLSTGGEHGQAGTLSPTQPPTALLYQLYLESGSLINVSDLWSAFNAVVGSEENKDEQLLMAFFQRGLAELKHFGCIKPSKKKADHVAKLAWRGL